MCRIVPSVLPKKMLPLLLLLIGLKTVACVDWCSITCESDDDTYKHTVCDRGPSCPLEPGCEDDPLFTHEMKKMVLEETNRFRNQIAMGDEPKVPDNWKKASDMMALSWDDELEYVVRCHIRRCKFEHDKCRSTPKYDSGQNLALRGYSKRKNCTADDVKELIAGWYGEVANMKPEYYGEFVSIPSLSIDEMIGHFTQLVWASTAYVGCALTTRKQDGESICILGCNYGPSGNYLGEAVYTQGEPCSKCPNGLKCNPTFKGLCGDIIEPSLSRGRISTKFGCSLVYSILVVFLVHF